MNNIGLTNNYADRFWRFIEQYLPNYYSRDDVLCDDILYRYVHGDNVSSENMQWIQKEFNGEVKLVKEELVRLEKKFMEESLNAYYEQFIST